MDSSTTDETPVLGADGYAICSDCKTRIHCGTVGLANLEKNHRGTKICMKAQEKRQKEDKATKRPTLLAFFNRPQPVPVPSTITPPALVQGCKLTPAREVTPALSRKPTVVASQAKPVPEPAENNFLEKLLGLIKNMPETIPEATDYDKLTVFAGNPGEFDVPGLGVDDVWEEVLNKALKSALGWGEEESMDRSIVKHGVQVGLFEGKLARLVTALEQKILNAQVAAPSSRLPTPNKELVVVQTSDAIDLTSDAIKTTDRNNTVPIDVDALYVKDSSQSFKTSATHTCKGYRLTFPEGKSPYSAYPFGLHDTRPLPWKSTLDDTMSIFLQNCTGRSNGEGKCCRFCRQLPENKNFERILTRLDKGIHPNAPHAYHGISSLQEVIQQKNIEIEFYRLRGLNQAKKLLGKTTALSEQKRLLMAISSGDVKRVDHYWSLSKKGARGLLASVMAAAQGRYHPRSYTEEEDMYFLLIWRLSGNCVAGINHRSGLGPSVSYLRTRSIVPSLIPSHGKPTTDQVATNMQASIGSILDVMHNQSREKVLHTMVMFDELAVEKRIRWDPKSNKFVGVCREHGHRTSLDFINEGNLEELFRRLDSEEESEKVHHAGEATVGALGILSKDHQLYPARPILVSGDCKRKTGEEHARLIKTVLSGIDDQQEKTKLRAVSLASNGETRWGSTFILLTFKHELSPSSTIYPILHPIRFLNLHVGNDDLTCNKDWKHVFKCFRNLLLRQRGVVINGIRITPDIIRDHFKSTGLSVDHIRSLFNPDDQQDVKLAFDLLKDVWSLPCQSNNRNPGVLTARVALWVLGKLLHHLVFPYLCVDLSLSEQIEHLSASAHLALALYILAGKDFIPTNLYIDIMIMIKNVIFTITKAKVDDPDSEFWIILLGTDHLEELFGTLRTMVGTDANLDILQLVSRLSGTTEVSNILAKYPKWDNAPQRLKLPAMSRKSNEPIPDSADHIKPASWRGNLQVKDVSLQTSWNRGRYQVEQDCEFIKSILVKLDQDEDVDILAPSGTLFFDIPFVDDDVDESLEYPSPPIANSEGSADLDAAETRIEVEDALGELKTTDAAVIALQSWKVETEIVINRKLKSKARILAEFSKYRKCVGSTDRLRCVQDIERHVQNKTVSSYASSDSLLPPTDDSDKIWLCIGEVNGLKFDGQSVPYVNLDILSEDTVTVSYQMLGLRSTTLDDDPDGVYDWQTYQVGEKSFTVPGRLIQPINPKISLTHTTVPWYLLQGTFLVTLAVSIFQELTVSNLKNIPKTAASKEYPYRLASGAACFLCNDDEQFADIGSSDCPWCSPTVALDMSQGQRVLEHIGAHILHDPHVAKSMSLCRLCLRPAPLCQFFLKKGKGATGKLAINYTSSKGCLMKVKFSYGVAAESTSASPCPNVPLNCPLCPKVEPTIWQYFLKIHFQEKHPNAPFEKYTHLWTLSNFEETEMKNIWKKRFKSTRRSKKSKIPPLVISEDHWAHIPGSAAPDLREPDNEQLSNSKSEFANEYAPELEDETKDMADDGLENITGDMADVMVEDEMAGVEEDGGRGNTDAVRNADYVETAVSLENDTSCVVELQPLPEIPCAQHNASKIADIVRPDVIIPDNTNAVVDDVPPQEMGCSKRKCVPRQGPLDALNRCLCGTVVDVRSEGVLMCKRVGLSPAVCFPRVSPMKLGLRGMQGVWGRERNKAHSKMMSYYHI
ncbi:LOW QUALITY PROTEIN: hypothetical protein CVT25_006605 [Psilocybe cyanescens]|uniref:Uncharacterized protein n=1 Tax=Psilocybe cyanescens TaxID=93625 RepID=A0A409XQ41_PSICY|nr:LOW QUALITY PROTEIN: hypothetical protein CVT25_006605 [Psilocybe cyanescens]